MEAAGGWFTKEVHRFTITGLSRSGKTMLFTSLMTILKYRSEGKHQCLPLLRYLPMELVESLRMEPLEGFEMFPLEDHLSALERGQWPRSTEMVCGFKAIIRLRQTHKIKKHLLPYTDVVLEFIDYPGEWITDLPMIDKTYAQWSDSCLAQQMSPPQKYYAAEWHRTLLNFNFDREPTLMVAQELVWNYRNYLKRAKQDGIAMLQPGSFLLNCSGFDWGEDGFTPLPTDISSDESHPWTALFTKHFIAFQENWLKPLRETTFRESDKQIILVDLFEGLNHSKSHVMQQKETLSHLADVFAYGQKHWFKETFFRKRSIRRVAFVATKADNAPRVYRSDLYSLLQDVASSAVTKLAKNRIAHDYFLLTSIHLTDLGSTKKAVRYTSVDGDYREARFDSLPPFITFIMDEDNYPVLRAAVPDDYLPRILSGVGMDKLFQYLLED
ncbi:YcjX family protein [Aestuariibacter sp. A3R04]|nr:YcjX family protein [Aestuariibacter sp. A3R04]